MAPHLDVAIIGASTAGLAAAELLARAGRHVGIFERQPSLHPARRTLIITPYLTSVLDNIPPTTIIHRTRVISVVTPAAHRDITLQEPDLIIERAAFTHFLAQRVADAGVTISYGHRFQKLNAHPSGVALRFATPDQTEHTVIARAVIGADGVFSDVAHAAGIRLPPVVPILQAEVQLPPNWNPDVTRVWFDVNETRFFFWLIPESAERGVVGLVSDNRAETSIVLQRFLQQHQFQPLAYQSAHVAMHHPRLRPWTQIGSAPVLLVGDAAGQVKVTTVGGTVTGLWGAAAAAHSLIHGCSYGQTLRPLKRELDIHWLIRRTLDRLDNADYTDMVRALNGSVQHILSHTTRDEMAGAMWRILRSQPRLLLFGMRLLTHRAPPPSAPGAMPLSNTE